jgi:hypothetical protein
MKIFRRSLLWMMTLAVPASLLLLPLKAQEKSAPPAPPPAPTSEPVPAPAPAPAPEPAKGEELPPDERVSADNNLSFPVDI